MGHKPRSIKSWLSGARSYIAILLAFALVFDSVPLGSHIAMADELGDTANEWSAMAEESAATALVYEDDTLVVAVEGSADVLPEGGFVGVEEILPVTEEKADAYGEALSSLAETLRESDRTYRDAKVYDICVMDANGNEIEPNGEVKVSISYKTALPMPDVAPEQVEVAHLDNEGTLSVLPADVTTDGAGAVEAAEFTTDSFSYYILFGTQEGSESEPINVGNYGWLKFSTPEDVNGEPQWGHYEGAGMLPATDTEEGYHRILQVRLHTLKQPAGSYDEGSYDDANYDFVTTNEYFWTWENSIFISDFFVPGYEVVQTKMHTAWSDPADDVWQDSLVGGYQVRGYRSSDGTSSDLNVLDVYMKSVPTPANAMRYIIRYVHADGSVTDGNVRYLESGSTGAINVDQPRTGERFSGIAVAAGDAAVTADSGARTVTFTYDENVNLAKAYVYFENESDNITTQTRGRYDKTDGAYYNAELGLYTDKSAELVEGKDREFLVNLEAWYIDEAASVGMVLDASGSMTWTAGVPTVLDLDSILNGLDWQTRNRILNSNMWNPISANDLNLILDRTAVDNSSLGYNGYEYYVYTSTATAANPISEYTPLGYADGRRDTSKSSTQAGGALVLGNNGTIEGYADPSANYAGAGWYYVNPSTTLAPFNAYGSKRFEGIPSNHMSDLGLGNNASPARFWVEVENGRRVLKCLFNCGNSNSPTATYPYYDNSNIEMRASGTQISTVYVKRDQMMTKSETLQDSIAQFGAILNGVSPASEVAMTRFSHRDYNDLQLMNWSNASEDMASAMDLVPGLTGNIARSDGTYQYAITGGTVTYRGIKEFQDTYKAHADSSPNSKYIVIFTDGKDQGLNHESNGQVTCDEIPYQASIYRSGSWRNYNGGQINLDDAEWSDYTVITMFMRSVGMSDSDVAASRTFLQNLASGGKDGDPNKKLFFEASSDSSHDVVEQFRAIAEHITTGLQNYSVRDYIDPRFDVVNDAGQVLTVLDENGQFTNATNPDVDATTGFRGFTTPDGKQAQLGYDPEREMFYVLWQGQDIQASPRNGSSVNTWHSQIRVTAKEDFIGGNDVLTNGNRPNENLVYKPSLHEEQREDSEGNPYTVLVPDYDQQGREIVDETQTRKSFPFASVNPGLLDVALGNYEDTIFLGEEITPGELISTMMGTDTKVGERADATAHHVADTVYNDDVIGEADPDSTSRYYLEYLERAGKKLHNDKNYYYTILQHLTLTGANGVAGLIAAAKSDTANYTVTETPSSVTITAKTGTNAEGEKITITKTGSSASIKVELPYYYLTSPTDPTTFAGPETAGVDPQEDRVGSMTYEWKVVDFADNVPSNDSKDQANDFVKFDTYVDKDNHMDTTRPLRLQFSMAYEPRGIEDAADGGNNGSARTRALTGLSGNPRDPDDPVIRDAVGPVRVAVDGEQNTTDEMGWAVIHAVDGRILLEKKIKTSDFETMQQAMADATMKLTLKGTGITSTNQDEEVWSKEFKISEAQVLRTSEDGVFTYLDLTDEEKDLWVRGLALGDYTLTETVENGFDKPVLTLLDVKFLEPETSDPAHPYNATPATWKADTTGTTDQEIVWHIGQVSEGTPSVSSYGNTDFSYGMVAGDLTTATPKNVDPALAANNGKAYLNAQLGRAEVTNRYVYLLPSAGGPGAYPFLLAGAFVAAYALGRAEVERRRHYGIAAGFTRSGRGGE